MAASALRTDDLRREPVLPPGFSLVALRESGDAFAHACSIAAEAGAATLVWTRRFDVIEFAVVLEPDNPLREARLAHYLAMTALADALAVYSPPERPILFRWPDALIYDLGLIGGGRLAWPEGCGEDEVPEWVVFGGMLRATTMATAGESKSPLCSYEIAANKQQWYFGQLPAQLSATFGSFSDVSATIFGSEYSFCNIF